MTFSVFRDSDRSTTTTDWVTSRHSFSFGDHYDPSNTHHGVLLVNNEEIVLPGQGFDTHPHRETEIVTWVTSGSLIHQDSEGNSGVIYPGLAQRMSAGRGILHSERNDTWHDAAGTPHPPGEPTRFVAMWILPDDRGRDPSYAQHDVDDDLATGTLVPVASGDPAVDSAIRIANRSSTLYAARLPAGGRARLPAGRHLHMFVADGVVQLSGETLATGDSLRGADLGGEPVTAAQASEVLIWSMDSALGDG